MKTRFKTLPGEVWLGLVKYPLYEISSYGRLRTYSHPSPDKPPLPRPRLVVGIRNDDRYRLISLRAKGQRLSLSLCAVHRLVLEAFVGPCPVGMEARHLDDVRSNNRLTNLAWGTPAENAADRVRNGLVPCGERHPHAKLRERDVREILSLHASGEKMACLATRFGVSVMTIRLLVARKSWKHLYTVS